MRTRLHRSTGQLSIVHSPKKDEEAALQIYNELKSWPWWQLYTRVRPRLGGKAALPITMKNSETKHEYEIVRDCSCITNLCKSRLTSDFSRTSIRLEFIQTPTTKCYGLRLSM
ncbi:hypothetical protein VP01_520g1 [Puccinia sorghi]|uniref:Uncharacterized protein n=1 Tax=Puccinia sorghi TaxID=27349 RepID=A0A0L6UKM1_9BASI|nr:hypothetical protein VP01_520g1 [Puccinia sorghi]